MTDEVVYDLSDYPLELLEHIFGALNGISLANVSSVCQLWRDLSNTEENWSRVLRRFESQVLLVDDTSPKRAEDMEEEFKTSLKFLNEDEVCTYQDVYDKMPPKQLYRHMSTFLIVCCQPLNTGDVGLSFKDREGAPIRKKRIFSSPEDALDACCDGDAIFFENGNHTVDNSLSLIVDKSILLLGDNATSIECPLDFYTNYAIMFGLNVPHVKVLPGAMVLMYTCRVKKSVNVYRHASAYICYAHISSLELEEGFISICCPFYQFVKEPYSNQQIDMLVNKLITSTDPSVIGSLCFTLSGVLGANSGEVSGPSKEHLMSHNIVPQLCAFINKYKDNVRLLAAVACALIPFGNGDVECLERNEDIEYMINAGIVLIMMCGIEKYVSTTYSFYLKQISVLLFEIYAYAVNLDTLRATLSNMPDNVKILLNIADNIKQTQSTVDYTVLYSILSRTFSVHLQHQHNITAFISLNGFERIFKLLPKVNTYLVGLFLGVFLPVINKDICGSFADSFLKYWDSTLSKVDFLKEADEVLFESVVSLLVCLDREPLIRSICDYLVTTERTKWVYALKFVMTFCHREPSALLVIKYNILNHLREQAEKTRSPEVFQDIVYLLHILASHKKVREKVAETLESIKPVLLKSKLYHGAEPWVSSFCKLLEDAPISDKEMRMRSENICLISHDGLHIKNIYKSSFPSATGNIFLTSGRWYYEVEIIIPEVMQIGWTRRTYDTFYTATNMGVGDDKDSWGCDLWRHVLFNGDCKQFGTSEPRWKSGDILQCSIDLDNRIMSFGINGKDLGVAASGFDVLTGFTPGMSLTEECKMNFGSTKFKYGPPTGYSGYNSLPK